jgi:hypothetical protein
MATDAAKQITREETRGSWLLWIAVLTGPTAWLLHLSINYSLEEWFACSPATQTRGQILGIGVDTVALLVNAVLVVATIVAGLIAVSCWRKLRSTREGNDITRPGWMALAGIMNSVLYLIIIVLGFAPPLILGVCEVTP